MEGHLVSKSFTYFVKDDNYTYNVERTIDVRGNEDIIIFDPYGIQIHCVDEDNQKLYDEINMWLGENLENLHSD